jgi:hypothetical protein
MERISVDQVFAAAQHLLADAPAAVALEAR